ncbi:MAG: hypothetical protein VXZ96_10980, partial [Myxococcota bacterium]|nr:hypothetical protein [Myxococcota bacterium]
LWNIEPRVSPDGKYIGRLDRYTVKVSRYEPESVRAFTGNVPQNPAKLIERQTQSFRVPYGTFDHGWDFVPNQEAIVLTGREENYPRGLFQEATGLTFELDGYDWNQLYVFKYPPLQSYKYGKDTIASRTALKGFRKKKVWQGEWHKIPNTFRGHDPSVNPEGDRIAFLEYTDGTINLATIDFDGSNKEYLTNYTDGTWMRTVDWSPDGTQLVVALHRNFQQNLYLVDAVTGKITPLMMDEWEEQDPHWSATDGRIYFSADPDGIANIYSYDPETEEYKQITNVINGAYSPQITADGDLIYLYYTANGWKVYGLPSEHFLNAEATQYFNAPFTEEYAADFMEEVLDYSHFDSMTTKYNPLRAVSSPVFIPIYRMTNDSRTNWGISAGAQMQLMDYTQSHNLFAYTLLGEDTILQTGYTLDKFAPTFQIFGGLFQGKFDQGFLLDEDNDPTTTEDQSIYEIRRLQSQRFFGSSASYQWNSRLMTMFGVSGFDFSLKGIDAVDWEPFMWSVSTNAIIRHSNNQRLARSPNPYYGHTFEAIWSHGLTDIVFEDYGGVNVDDGELLDRYQYNRYEARYTKNFSIPAFGFDFLREAQNRKHVIQLDTQFGMIDRNVALNDEFRAGGRHPYNLGYGSIQPNTPFAGYPAWSLGGETMMIANMAYRFPLTRPEQKWMHGPLYITGVYAQFGGTAGNLWSFRPPSDPADFYRSRFDERIAYNSEDVVREIPFRDIAYKNGNYMLYDLSFELRMSSVLYHTMSWDSFFRLAYGFNEIRGWGDVDGDDIFDTNDSAVGDELSNETEPAGFRIYLGLGTGW